MVWVGMTAGDCLIVQLQSWLLWKNLGIGLFICLDAQIVMIPKEGDDATPTGQRPLIC